MSKTAFVYYCPLSTCKARYDSPIAPSEPPVCEGESKTHWKQMTFNAEESTGTPPYLNKKKSKK